MAKERKYDLEERLLEYASEVIRCVDSLRPGRAAHHIGDQLLRAGTSPLFNHGEAESAESPKDFVHKLKICLKELREAFRALRLIERTGLSKTPDLTKELIIETDELIRIFYRSIETTKSRMIREPDAENPYTTPGIHNLHSMFDVGCSMLDVQFDTPQEGQP